MKHAIAIVVVALCVEGCAPGQQQLVDALRAPTITANPIPPTLFLSPVKVLSANITAGGSALEIFRVELRLNRDRDPSRFSLDGAPTFVVTSPPQAGNVTVTLPQSFALKPGQLLTARWFVDYRVRTGGTDVATVSSTASIRQACSAAQTTVFLNQLQAAATNSSNFPQTLTSLEDLGRLATKGFAPTHGFVSFRGMGVAFAAAEALRPQELIDVASALGLPQFTLRPHLVLYAPSPGATAPAVSEPLRPDFPYTLIGFAFASPYSPAGPPEFGCLPREAWFVHEAGWHPSNGSFVPQVMAETAPGELNPSLPPLIGDPRDQRFGAIWHPRLWDVHFWINPSGPTPIVSQCNPAPGTPPLADFFAATGAATCAVGAPTVPPIGAPFPPGGFFVRGLPL